MDHLDACKTVSVAELAAEREAAGDTIPPAVRQAADAGIRFMRCAEGCPVREQTLARGRELAAKHD